MRLKNGCIALIFLLFMQTGGLLLIYKMQQSIVQYAMLETIKEKQTGFLKLTLTVAEFQKSKINAHEISYRGMLYDFKSAIVSGNTVELLAISDTEEKNILEKIKALTTNTDNQHSELPNKLLKLLTLTYICPVIDYKFILQELQKNIFLPLCENKISFTNEVTSPPPELV